MEIPKFDTLIFSKDTNLYVFDVTLELIFEELITQNSVLSLTTKVLIVRLKKGVQFIQICCIIYVIPET